MDSKRSSLYGRWKAFAMRAAQIQSRVVLWIFYYLLFVPVALVQRAGHRTPSGRAPAWVPRTTRTSDLTSARRQY